MRKSRFSESQIVEILKEAEGGVAVAGLLRKHSVSKATLFRWRSKYGGATVADVKRPRELEHENAARRPPWRLVLQAAVHEATMAADRRE